MARMITTVLLATVCIGLSAGCAAFTPAPGPWVVDRSGRGPAPATLGPPEGAPIIPEGEPAIVGRVPTAPENAEDPAPAVTEELIGPQMLPPQDSLPSRLDVQVTVPARKQVGSEVTFEVRTTNLGGEPATDVVVECSFDDALVFPGHPEKTVQQHLNRIAPGETKEAALTLRSDRTGTHCCRFRITSGGREAAWKSVCLEFVPRQLELSVIGPVQRSVGSRAEYNVRLVNVSAQAIEGLHVRVQHDGALTPKEITEGADLTGEGIRWDLGRINPGEGLFLQVEFEAAIATEQACITFEVGGTTLPTEVEERCLQVRPLRGVLDLQVSDETDLLEVGDETVYVATVRNTGLQPVADVRLHATVPQNFRVESVEVRHGDEVLTVPFETRGREIVFSAVESLTREGVLEYRVRAKSLQAGDGEFRASLTDALSRDPAVVAEPTSVR